MNTKKKISLINNTLIQNLHHFLSPRSASSSYFSLMKLFSEFRSCYRSPSTAATPADDDPNHRAPPQASPRSRVHRYHWRPSLSVIVEDSNSMDQDHRSSNNVGKKPQTPRKSVATKPKSSFNYNTCSFLTDNRT